MMWKWIGMRIERDKSCGVIALLLLTMAATAIAQDTRQVTEPKIPQSCVQLPAQLFDRTAA